MNILLLALASLLALSACGRSTPATTEAAEPAADNLVRMSLAQQQEFDIQVQPVERTAIPQVLHVTGRLSVNENKTWRVGAVTEGRIVEVIANPGDRVQAGQVLARMHSHEVHDGRAAYRKAVADLAQA